MTKKTRSTLATAFAVVAVILLVAVTAAAGIIALSASRDIQGERARSIRTACTNQNQRNAKAYVFLQGLPVNANSPAMTPAARTKLIHEFTDALVGPVQNCDAVVARSVHSK